MKEYIVLDKELTGLPVNIYIPKDKPPHIMFQNDYEDTPNPDNLIRMELDGTISDGDNEE